MGLEPGLGGGGVRAMREDEPPEPRAVIEMPQMRHFMRGDYIVE
jgi:hypothetical protein